MPPTPPISVVDPVPWYKSPTLRGLTSYAALLILTAVSHREWGKVMIAATGIDADFVQSILDNVVQVGGLALAGWLAKKRIAAGAQATPPAPIVATQATADRITGTVPKPAAPIE
jgi:hypothetical protein